MKKRNLLGMSLIGAGLFLEEAYRYMFCSRSSKLFTLLFDSKGHGENYYKFRDDAAERLKKCEHTEYTMTSARGEKLKGFYYPCGADGKKIVFIIHGYRSNHIETGGMFYDYYKNKGIDVFCCDHTACGDSQGHFIGFDIYETSDCLNWIEFLKAQFGNDVQIILHGFSMGAATVMQMSSKCPENVRFIIEDSGYVNAKSSLRHQVGIMYQPLRWLNRIIAGYDINASDVTESLLKSKVPVLFVHGQDDELVPYENGPMLYRIYQGDKDYFFPKNTKHIESMYTSGVKYGEKIDKFVDKYIK